MTDTKKSNLHQGDNNPARELVEASIKANDEASNLDQIRQLLFGDQVKEVEQKRLDLRQELKHSLSSMQHETRAQFEQISADIQTLYRLLNDESELRLSETTQINEQMNAQVSQLKLALDDANTQHSDAQKALDTKLSQEAARIEEDSRQSHNAILAKLDEAAKQLKSDKADRSDLAKMLRGVAEQLLEEHR